VRVSELAREAGVALSSVKYYQREGLLPPGVRGAPNQVEYGAAHVQRVRLVRALLETGGLSVAVARRVVGALDTQGAPIAEAFGVAQHAMSTARTPVAAPSAVSRERILDLMARIGWRAGPDNPGVTAAARALDGLGTIGFTPSEEYLDAYAEAAGITARADLEALTTRSEADGITELMVVGTVLGDPLAAGLRRIAQQDATHDAFPQHGAAVVDRETRR